MISHHISVDSTVCTTGEILRLEVCGLFAIGDKVHYIFFYINVYLHLPWFCGLFLPFLKNFPFGLLLSHCLLFPTILCALGFSITSMLPVWGALF